MATQELACNVKVFNSDDKLIYESLIDSSSTIFSLKISLYTQSLSNIKPSDQQILFNHKEIPNSASFLQIYNLNNRNKVIKLRVIKSQKHHYSQMDELIVSTKHAFSGDATRIHYDAELSHDSTNAEISDVDENVEMINTKSPSRRKYSYHSDTTSVGDNVTNSPFFARRGSMSVTGPTTLRFLLRTSTGQYTSDSQRSPTPYSPQQLFLNEGDNMYQPIPQSQQRYYDHESDDNNEYYQHKKSQLMDVTPKMQRIESVGRDNDDDDDMYDDIDMEKLRHTSRGSRKSVDESIHDHDIDTKQNNKDDKIEYEYKLQNDWKTGWKGILLIGFLYFATFHNLYSCCCLSINLIHEFNMFIFDIGLMYCATLFGISIGILISSIILNQPSMIQSSQMIATYSIFVVLLSQVIACIVFYYAYYYKYDALTMFYWYVLLTSRFLLGLSIGFIETAIDNLLFEWFVIVDEMYFISKARPYTLLLKEFGHCSARLLLVPLVYITFTDYKNLFFALFVGVILSALSWLSMIYAAIKDSMMSYNNAYNINHYNYNNINDEKQKKPLLPSYTINKNKWIMKGLTLDILSYKKWHDMGYFGLNTCVFLSIIYLSLNFAISFTFIILSITSFVEQYGYTDYTSNLLLCLIPLINVTCNGLIRDYLLSPLKSEWMVAFIGAIAFSTSFSLLSWLNIYGLASLWLPIICILLFIFGYECFTAAGYELLLSVTKQEIHGLISSINSTTNYLFSAIFIIIFSILVIEHDQNVNITFKYQWAYSFLAFASYFNTIIIVLLKLYHSDSAQI